MSSTAIKNDEKKSRSTVFLYLLVVIGNILALAGDASTTWSSPVLPKLITNDTSENPFGRPITDDEVSWLGSLNCLGALIGLYPLGFLPDVIGRKPTCLLFAVMHTTAYLMFAFSSNMYVFYVGRVLNGAAVAAAYITFPLYVAEIAEDDNRGFLLCSYTVFASMGSLLAYVTGPYLSIMYFDILMAIFPFTFCILFAWLAPESPYYHLLRKNKEKAKEVLHKVKRLSDEECLIEMKKIQDEIDESHGDWKSFFETFTKKYAINGTLIGLGLGFFQQVCGFGAFIGYTQMIFSDSGSSLSEDISSIIVGAVFFVASFVCPLLIERAGRKFLMYLSIGGVIAAEITFGTFYLLKSRDYDVSSFMWIPILSLMSFMVFYNIGLAPLAFTMVSEILPINIKFFSCTASGFCGWAIQFLCTKYFMNLNDSLGEWGTMYLFAGASFVNLLFVIFYVPETKGKSFLEIQRILDK